MHLFYAPNIEKDFTLSEQESHHAVKVLRLQAGATILVLDGNGSIFEATIAVPHAKHCLLNSLKKVNNDEQNRNYYLHIAIAPTKNMDRLEWFAEKAVEIGIDEITPLYCRFSERKNLNTDRVEKILVSAMKQSMQAFKTKLNEPIKFNDFMKIASADQKFIAHCHDIDKVALSHAVEKKKNILILIGPEGDFSSDEVQTAISNDFKAISLGQTRLRVETAALVACHTVCLINEI